MYYLRDRVGRAARVAEKVMTKEEKARAQELRSKNMKRSESEVTDKPEAPATEE